MSTNNTVSTFSLFSIVQACADEFSPLDNQLEFPASEIKRVRIPSYLRALQDLADSHMILPADFIHSVDTYLTALQKYSRNPCDSHAFKTVKSIHQTYKISRKPLFPFSIESELYHFPFPLYAKDPDVARYLAVRSPQYFKGGFSLGVDGNHEIDETTG